MSLLNRSPVAGYMNVGGVYSFLFPCDWQMVECVFKSLCSVNVGVVCDWLAVDSVFSLSCSVTVGVVYHLFIPCDRQLNECVFF